MTLLSGTTAEAFVGGKDKAIGPEGPLSVVAYGNYVTTTPLTESPELALEKTLAYVSEARAAVHAKRLSKLPRGRRGNGYQCVLARALPFCRGVSPTAATFATERTAEQVAQAWATKPAGNMVALPLALRQFVYYFDNRAYPDLIA